MDLGLKDKVALVAGGSEGIGAAVAEVLTEEGAKVAICGRTLASLKETRDRIDREVISYVLKTTHWNRGRAAKILDVSYKMLHGKINELNIKPLM